MQCGGTGDRLVWIVSKVWYKLCFSNEKFPISLFVCPYDNYWILRWQLQSKHLNRGHQKTIIQFKIANLISFFDSIFQYWNEESIFHNKDNRPLKLHIRHIMRKSSSCWKYFVYILLFTKFQTNLSCCLSPLHSSVTPHYSKFDYFSNTQETIARKTLKSFHLVPK